MWTRLRIAEEPSARWQWEASHAVNAGITLLALVLIMAAVVVGARADKGRDSR